MSKKNRSNIPSVIARAALAFVFAFGQTAWAVQGQNAKDQPTSNAAAKPQQTPANPSAIAGAKARSTEEEPATEESSSKREESHRGGPHEGIKVHGHWTIEVRNPDGSIVTHREFENSLVQPAAALASILGRTGVNGIWIVNLSDTPPPNCLVCQPTVLSITEPSQAFSGTSTNLTVGVSGANVTLNGSAIIPGAITLSQVSTSIEVCPTGITQAACVGSFSGVANSFSAAAISNGGQSVTTGQTIAVTVVFSFS